MRKIGCVLLLLFVLDLLGCVAPKNVSKVDESTNNGGNSYAFADGKSSSFVDGKSYAVVRVFYATDRAHGASSEPSDYYGEDRADLTYGQCEVSIPRDHRMGEIEGPSIWRLEFRENPEKHVVLLKVTPEAHDNFIAELKNRIAASSRKSAFLFIHGYNVTFQDAAKRTAQISYDLGFDGAPIFYSWPSRGSTMAYTYDEANIEWTITHLQSVIKEIATKAEAENIYLIAHSMGNRALTRAVIAAFNENPSLRNRFREVILAAPDIDADVFRRDIAPALAAASKRVTLYVSSHDRALNASKKFHGYPRAGDISLGVVLVPGVDTIDASNVDTSFRGHSYFAENKSVLSDIFFLVRDNKQPADRFGLKPIDTEKGRYWMFRE
jgi:esterase/lipase superfamily enzyme